MRWSVTPLTQTTLNPHRLNSVLLAKRYFDCQKTEGAGLKPPREAARSYNSREFFVGILGAGVRSRELMPYITAIFGRLASEITADKIGGRQAHTETTPGGAHLRTRLPLDCM
jgi:hypothetical protein